MKSFSICVLISLAAFGCRQPQGTETDGSALQGTGTAGVKAGLEQACQKIRALKVDSRVKRDINSFCGEKMQLGTQLMANAYDGKNNIEAAMQKDFKVNPDGQEIEVEFMGAVKAFLSTQKLTSIREALIKKAIVNEQDGLSVTTEINEKPKAGDNCYRVTESVKVKILDKSYELKECYEDLLGDGQMVFSYQHSLKENDQRHNKLTLRMKVGESDIRILTLVHQWYFDAGFHNLAKPIIAKTPRIMLESYSGYLNSFKVFSDEYVPRRGRDSGVLEPGESLPISAKLYSPGHTHYLVVQNDGNVCSYRADNGARYFCTDSHTNALKNNRVPVSAKLENNGSFRVTDAEGQVIFDTPALEGGNPNFLFDKDIIILSTTSGDEYRSYRKLPLGERGH